MTKKVKTELFPGEHKDIRQDLRDLLQADPEPWLDIPHPWFFYRKPREYVGTDREWLLRNWIRMVKSGMVT